MIPFHPENKSAFKVTRCWTTDTGKVYEATLIAETPPMECPYKDSWDRRPHTLIKDGTKEVTKRDVVDGLPCVVTLTTNEYECKRCKRKTSDWRSPYYNLKSKTTERFDELIAQTIIDQHFSTRDLSSVFGVSKNTIKASLDKYLNRINNGIFASIPCDELWISAFTYNGKKRAMILGRPSDQFDYKTKFGHTKPEGIVLLGLAEEYTVNSITSAARVYNAGTIKKIYCNKSIADDFRQPRGPEVITKGTEPEGASELKRIIKRYEANRNSFDVLQLIIMFNDKYRVSEVKAAGLGDFLGNTSNLPFTNGVKKLWFPLQFFGEKTSENYGSIWDNVWTRHLLDKNNDDGTLFALGDYLDNEPIYYYVDLEALLRYHYGWMHGEFEFLD